LILALLHSNKRQNLITLSKAAITLQHAISHLTDAAKICYDKSQTASEEYLRNSYRMRAATFIEQAEKIKQHLSRQPQQSRDGTLNMSSLEAALGSVSVPKTPPNARELTKPEWLAVLKASKIYGQTYKPWPQRPNPEDFQTPAVFHDTFELNIPCSFGTHLVEWQRAEGVIPPQHLFIGDERPKPTMASEGKIDLVQDAGLDCSFVAGLCAIVGRTERGFRSVSSSFGSEYAYLLTLCSC
jgi:hypothetical protein